MNKIIIIIIAFFSQTYLFSKEIIIESIDSSFKKDYKCGIFNINCQDSLHCLYACFDCTDLKNHISNCNQYLITNNGGKTWECVSIDCSAWIYDSSLNNYIFYNSQLIRKDFNTYYSFFYDYYKNELIASFDSGKISRSYDYGKTWVIEKDSIFDNYKIDGFILIFLDGNRAIGYNNNVPNPTKAGYARLFISGPDYKNWRNIPILDSIIEGGIYSVFNFKNKFYLLNENKIEKEFKFCFSKTEDNGKNWTTYTLEVDSGRISPSCMFFLNDTIGWIIANYYTEKGKIKIAVFYTSDGGNSWNIISDFFSDDTIRWPLFYNKDEGVIFGSYLGYITKDGGKTWEKLTYNENKFPYPILKICNTKKNEFLCTTANGVNFRLIIPEE